VLGDMPWGTHLCHFYETNRDLLEAMIPYFKAGLENNEFCLWVISDPLTEEEAKSALRQAVPDFERHLADRRVEIVSHREWYLNGGRFDLQRVIKGWNEKLEDALARGFAGMRVSGNTAWMQREDWRDFREYEMQLEELLAGRRMIALCTYHLAATQASQLLDVARIHQSAVACRCGHWEVVETPAIKQAKQEIEKLNEELERKVEERTRELATTNEALKREIMERAAQALRYKTLMETSTDSIYVMDEKGDLQEANEAFLRQRGYSAAEVKGLRVADWDAQWSREQLQERLRKQVGSSAVFETRHRSKDGSIFDVEVCSTSVRIGEEQLFFCVARDITERKQAEDRLRASEERFRRYFELGLIGMAITSPTKGCIEVNDEICRILGYERSELLRMTWAELTHPDDLAVDVTHFNRVLAGEIDGYSMEKRYFRKDGQVIDASISVKCLRRPDGSVDYFVGLLRDVTERKRAEERLRKVGAQLADAQRLAHIGSWEWDIPTDTVTWSDEKYRLMGMEPQEVPVTYASFLNCLHPDDRARVDQAVQQALREHQPFSYEYRAILPKGEVRLQRVEGTVVTDESGRVVRMFGTTQDITERKLAEEALRESEARTRLLIKSSNIGLWDWNLITNEVFYSPEWKSQLGYANDEVPGRYQEWESRLHPEDREASVRAVQDFREGRREVYDIEFRLRHKDGSWRSILTRADLIRDAAGQPVRMLGCHIDITERKKAERQIEHFAELFQALSHRLLEVQEEERRHLARELHDEIGQALTAAKLNLKIIAPEVPPAAAGRIEDSIQLLDRLLLQVRQLSLDLRPPLLDELGLVPALRWLADQQAQRAGLRVQFTADADHVEMEPSVRTGCFRVAQEAITNAIRHAKAKTIAVEIRQERDRLWLTVRDDGAGFDPVAVGQQAAHGASVGLLSMKERALLTDGGLEIDSSPGRGTEIRAWFPLMQREPRSTTEPA
jgi:PAS domain S-box-containing protein